MENFKINEIEALKLSIENMDINMISLFLNDNQKYRLLPKEIFLIKLKQAFKDFNTHGDTCLDAFEGLCGDTFDKNKIGYIFRGRTSFNYMTIVFKCENNKIYTLCECGNLKIQNPKIELNKQIYIDEFGDPF